MKKIVLAENEPGVRIDSYIAERAELSRSYAAKLCTDGLVPPKRRALREKHENRRGRSD